MGRQVYVPNVQNKGVKLQQLKLTFHFLVGNNELQQAKKLMN